MAKNYEQLQQQQTFDELMRFLDSQFKSFPDHRAGNAVRYELADVVKSAFAMFSLKSPSLLDFKKQTIPEESNLRQIYRIEGCAYRKPHPTSRRLHLQDLLLILLTHF